MAQRREEPAVLTPSGFEGDADADAAVYIIPIAEALPAEPKRKRRRQNEERGRRATGSDAIATLDGRRRPGEEGDWRTTLFGGWCGPSPTYWLRVLLCPCATAAAVNERLGSSYELALLFFGVLASGVFVCVGLAITYDQTNRSHHKRHDHDGPRDWPPRGSDGSAFFDGEHGGSMSWPPPPRHEDDISLGKDPQFWSTMAVACFLLFLLGVWMLRDQTRKRLALRGTKLGDMIVSLSCCCCALGQMDIELKHLKSPSDSKSKRQPDRRGDSHNSEDDPESDVSPEPVTAFVGSRQERREAPDTLAAYPVAALV